MTPRLSELSRTLLVAAMCLTPVHAASAPEAAACVPVGEWIRLDAAFPAPAPPAQFLAHLSRRKAVLLGESHDSAEHHRWQLHTISGLHALNPDMVLAFEMFPRRLQSVLDDWTAGQLTEAEFLRRSEWSKVWGHDAQLYLPIFHFARMHRVPMVALNVERSLVRQVGERGWAAVPADAREDVSDPAPPSRRYVESLYASWLEHLPPDHAARRRAPTETDYRVPEFVHFVESMQVWDRAMAERIAARARSAHGPLVVAIMGSGHLRDGFGVPYQLASLGVQDVAVLLPWDREDSCSELTPGLADAVFGVDASKTAPPPERPRLGILLEQAEQGVAVREVVKGSIAEQAGIRSGDIIEAIAGRKVGETADVIATVQRQAPGTWLPLTVNRNGTPVELVARFPAAP
jgi:uncharacterized iron-regulated protein